MTDEAKTFLQRLIHRPIPIVICLFYMYQMQRIISWYMVNPEIGYAESGGLAAVVMGGVAFFKYYVETGAEGS